MQKKINSEKFKFIILFQKSYCILREAYGKHAPSQDTCWFKRFKSDDFDMNDEECPDQPKKFKDQQLQTLLNKDECQT